MISIRNFICRQNKKKETKNCIAGVFKGLFLNSLKLVQFKGSLRPLSASLREIARILNNTISQQRTCVEVSFFVISSFFYYFSLSHC